MSWNITLTSFILFELSNYICNFIGILYSQILLPSKLFWLSNRCRESSVYLKYWHHALIPKVLKILVDFLNNPLSKAYYFLISSFQHLFSNRIMQIERKENCVVEVLHCLKEIAECVKERMDQKIILLSVKAVLKRDSITNKEQKAFQL